MISLTSIDRRQALRYAGMRGEPDWYLSELADNCEKRLLYAIFPKYTYRIYPLESCAEGIACKGSSLMLTGQDIASHLDGCSRAVLLCVTLSAGADRCIRAAQTENVTAGLIIDAMASAAVEQVCDLAEREILAELSDSHPTWRFSPGYGDLPLSLQGDFLAAIDAMRRVGVTVSDSGLLFPRKSITAIIGLSDSPVQKKKKGCAVCNLSKICPYRAKGEHCQ